MDAWALRLRQTARPTIVIDSTTNRLVSEAGETYSLVSYFCVPAVAVRAALGAYQATLLLVALRRGLDSPCLGPRCRPAALSNATADNIEEYGVYSRMPLLGQ